MGSLLGFSIGVILTMGILNARDAQADPTDRHDDSVFVASAEPCGAGQVV